MHGRLGRGSLEWPRSSSRRRGAARVGDGKPGAGFGGACADGKSQPGAYPELFAGSLCRRYCQGGAILQECKAECKAECNAMNNSISKLIVPGAMLVASLMAA